MSLEDKEPGRIERFREDHPRVSWAIVITALILVIAMVFYGGIQKRNEERQAQIDKEASAELSASDKGGDNAVPAGGNATAGDNINGGTDKQIAQLQPALEEQYGKPPTGFVWDQQGNPISLGIKDMSSDDVVFAYVRALSTLDIGLSQKLSRDSTVVATYSGYFNGTNTKSQDYNDEFNRNSYRAGLLSLQVNNVSDTSVFAENQRVYTVEATMIDFSNKDFWQADRDNLFNQLYQFDVTENDSSKAEKYVNDYIEQYYSSPNVKKHNVTFTLTLRKYPDLNSGWLVSVDKDLDDLLTNADGVPTNRYIMSEYQKYKQDRQQKEREATTGA